jgi:hypothetical protein
MKKYTIMLVLVAFVMATAGCKLFKKEEEQKPPEPTPAPAVQPPEKAAPPEEVKEEKKVEEPETLVSREDIEKAAKIYNVLHDEEMKDKEKKDKFAKMLEKNEWDLEKYEQIVFDIGRDPESTKIYKELQEQD